MNKRMRRGFVAVSALAALALSSLPALAQGSNLDISVCDPAAGAMLTANPGQPNTYFPLSFSPYVLVGPDSDGTTHGLRITDDGTTTIHGNFGSSSSLQVRVIEEFEWHDNNANGVYEPSSPNNEGEVEDSFNYFAQLGDTTVCYFGETLTFPDAGGSWQAGLNGAKPGIFMPGSVKPGLHYMEENAPNDNALDQATIVGQGPFTLHGVTYQNAIRIKEFSSLEKASNEYKIYAPGVGLLVDDTLQRCTPTSTPGGVCS